MNAGHGQLVVLDQADNNTYSIDIPTRESRDKVPSRFPSPNRPSLFWGNEHLWSNPPYDPADPHNPMIDSKGRVWMTSKIRGNADATWCSDPSNKYADWFPLRNSARQASFYDPKTKQFTLIDTCYSTHHLQFDNDPDETVYFNELSGPIFGWIDTKVYDQTHDEQQAVGWCGQVLDTNGDGKITKPFQIARQSRAGDASILYSTDTAPAETRTQPLEDAAEAPLPQGSATADPKLDTHGQLQLVCDHPQPGGRFGVGRLREPVSGYARSPAARQQSAVDLQDDAVQGARAGLRSARRGYRQQRCGLDRSGGIERSGQLRRAQVQEPERSREGRRQPVPGRLDALSDHRVRS